MVGEDEYLPLWKGGKSEKSPTAYAWPELYGDANRGSW